MVRSELDEMGVHGSGEALTRSRASQFEGVRRVFEDDEAGCAAADLNLTLAGAWPTQADIDLVSECLQELAWSLAPLGHHWRLGPFGSVKNLFMTHGSDIDVAIYRVDGHGEGDSAMAAEDLRQKVMPLVAANPRFVITNLITNARVPVLSLRFDSSLDVDLSSRNTEPMRNTQLLRTYAEAHSLVHPNFLLPCLPTYIFNGFSQMPPAAKVSWDCISTLVDALLQFFTFFAHEFQWGSEVVSVRMGCRLLSMDRNFAKLAGTDVSRLHIEDPFLCSRNLNCVLGADQEAQLHSAFCGAEADLQAGVAPIGLRREATPEDNTAQGMLTWEVASGDMGWEHWAVVEDNFAGGGDGWWKSGAWDGSLASWAASGWAMSENGFFCGENGFQDASDLGTLQ